MKIGLFQAPLFTLAVTFRGFSQKGDTVRASSEEFAND